MRSARTVLNKLTINLGYVSGRCCGLRTYDCSSDACALTRAAHPAVHGIETRIVPIRNLVVQSLLRHSIVVLRPSRLRPVIHTRSDLLGRGSTCYKVLENPEVMIYV
jgi:hypothetical protein